MPAGRKKNFNLDEPGTASALDELSLWSAPFGMALLDKVEYRPAMRVLDLGFGTGFPLLELAERLGASSTVYGLDPWRGGAIRARAKARARGVMNALVVRGTAEHMPFHDGAFDLLVSNNGLNNVARLPDALAECRRVCRAGAALVMTVNLPGTMDEFYAVYRTTLVGLGMEDALPRIDGHIRNKRLPRDETLGLLRAHGFQAEECGEHSFTMRFASGSALFGHSFMRLAFMGPWREVVGAQREAGVFALLEEKLNDLAAANGGLALSVPFICVRCRAE
jgi:arsenite methyltransferase